MKTNVRIFIRANYSVNIILICISDFDISWSGYISVFN